MKLFDVYPKYPFAIQKAEGSYVWDHQGTRILDLYGGHAVISIGHSHPHYIKRISSQLQKVSYYSNAVEIPEQKQLADLLGAMSGYTDYQLFLCNSGAEANENAFKLASFHTGRGKMIVFEKGFHGRTSLAVAATDSQKLVAKVNETAAIIRVPMGDLQALKMYLNKEVAAVCIEGIQGIAGIYEPETEFIREVAAQCKLNGSLMILDEIQSGYGRTGKFFAHQHYDLVPDIITIAKGMGNGFPVGGVLIAPNIKPWSGMLGTTFGGNQLACAASIAVLEIMEKEGLVQEAAKKGEYLIRSIRRLPQVKEVRGRGLMIGIEMPFPVKRLRETLLFEYKIFTGSAANAHTIRLLPPLSIQEEQLDNFLQAFEQVTQNEAFSVG